MIGNADPNAREVAKIAPHDRPRRSGRGGTGRPDRERSRRDLPRRTKPATIRSRAPACTAASTARAARRSCVSARTGTCCSTRTDRPARTRIAISLLSWRSSAAQPLRRTGEHGGEEGKLRRIGSNIRKQNSDAKAHRVVKNIIRYTDEESPRNEYPKKIVSPPQPVRLLQRRQPRGRGRDPRDRRFQVRVQDLPQVRLRAEVLFPGDGGHERGGPELPPVEALHGPVARLASTRIAERGGPRWTRPVSFRATAMLRSWPRSTSRSAPSPTPRPSSKA